jgi:hypothetical protein
MQNKLPAILTGLSLIMLPFLCSAQMSRREMNRRDIVYLKNGSIIKGTILEMVPNGNIKIETADHSIFVFRMEEVERTEKQAIRSKRYGTDSLKLAAIKPTGFFLIGKIGFKGSDDEPDFYDISETLIIGKHVNDYLSIGLGVESVGFGFDPNGNSLIPVYPVFADFRFYIPTSYRVSPMFVFDLGRTFMGNKRIDYNSSAYSDGDFVPDKGGLYVSLGAGLRIKCNKRFSFIADMGLGLQKFRGNTYERYYNSNGIYQYMISTAANHTTPFVRGSIGLCISFGK